MTICKLGSNFPQTRRHLWYINEHTFISSRPTFLSVPSCCAPNASSLIDHQGSTAIATVKRIKINKATYIDAATGDRSSKSQSLNAKNAHFLPILQIARNRPMEGQTDGWKEKHTQLKRCVAVSSDTYDFYLMSQSISRSNRLWFGLLVWLKSWSWCLCR